MLKVDWHLTSWSLQENEGQYILQIFTCGISGLNVSFIVLLCLTGGIFKQLL